MMKTTASYFEKRSSAILSALKKPRSKYTPATFHQLRVEIKKLKSLVKLLAYSSDHVDAEATFKPFRKIFNYAGQVREIQVQQAVLGKQSSDALPEEYKVYLKEKEERKKQKYFSLINADLIKKVGNSFRLMDAEISQISRKKGAGFMQLEKNKILKILKRKNLRADDLHTLRKFLKSYSYSLRILSGSARSKSGLDLAAFTDMVGEWHDYHMIIRDLKNPGDLTILSPDEVAKLKNIRVGMIAETDELLCRINAVRRQVGILEVFSEVKPKLPGLFPVS